MVSLTTIEQSPVKCETTTEKESNDTRGTDSNENAETKETKKGFPFHDLAKLQKQYKNKSSRNESLVALIYLLGSMLSFCLLIFFTDFYLIPLFPTTTTMTDYIVFNFYLLNVFVFCMVHLLNYFYK
ncbi:ANL_HP_G0166300.mRNA.1.CDS.1 [Saccharomyces cerevisiae]|nr:ANL_HP_G0166300.mRNA.1.CDS.1 [Saccharomyces cerevisiae]CAI7017145.1 ANL_HP_G0166300.mRNA.1.CDS.1 [Saccharomyces cerevisiae]